MKRRNLLITLGLLPVVSSCTSSQTDPFAASLAARYHAQSIVVTPTASFVSDLSGLRGGTPQELAAEFVNEVQTGLDGDLKGVMRGSAPARINIEINALDILDTGFSPIKLTIRGSMRIVDAETGASITNILLQADNADMRDATARDPAAALAGVLILKAMVPAKNLALWNVAKVLRRQIQLKLGAKEYPGLRGGVL